MKLAQGGLLVGAGGRDAERSGAVAGEPVHVPERRGVQVLVLADLRRRTAMPHRPPAEPHVPLRVAFRLGQQHRLAVGAGLDVSEHLVGGGLAARLRFLAVGCPAPRGKQQAAP